MKNLSAILVLAALAWCACPAAAAQFPPVTLAGMEFRQLEVARTDQERAVGLMRRDWLADDGGMLFLMPAQQPATMWMKHTRIPLDCLFLDAAGKVLQVTTMAVEPPQRPGETEADYEKRLPLYHCPGRVACVVELRAGLAAQLGIRAGTRLPSLALWEILREMP